MAPGAELHFAYLLGERWRLAANGAVEVPLGRDQFEYEGTDQTIALFRQSPVSARFEIGLGFAW